MKDELAVCDTEIVKSVRESGTVTIISHGTVEVYDNVPTALMNKAILDLGASSIGDGCYMIYKDDGTFISFDRGVNHKLNNES